MSFFQRAASLAAMSLGMIGLIAASTPGFAFELDRTVNVPSPLPVPLPTLIPDLGLPNTPALPPEHLDFDVFPTRANAAEVTEEKRVTEEAIEYASLSAAVAAQDAPDAIDADLLCMAGAVYFESKGEPLAGQLAVAEVILNRAKSGRFPKSICSVVTQRGQFSFVRGGKVPSIAPSAAYRTAIAVAQVAMADRWDSPASDALYFHARRVAPGWRMSKVAAIGNHIFYR